MDDSTSVLFVRMGIIFLRNYQHIKGEIMETLTATEEAKLDHRFVWYKIEDNEILITHVLNHTYLRVYGIADKVMYLGEL